MASSGASQRSDALQKSRWTSSCFTSPFTKVRDRTLKLPC